MVFFPWLGLHPAGSSVHGILQAQIPEWVAIPFSRGDQIWVSCITGSLNHLSHQASQLIMIPRKSSSVNLRVLCECPTHPGASASEHRLRGARGQHLRANRLEEPPGQPLNRARDSSQSWEWPAGGAGVPLWKQRSISLSQLQAHTSRAFLTIPCSAQDGND